MNIKLGPALIPSVPEKTKTAGMIWRLLKGQRLCEDLNLINSFI